MNLEELLSSLDTPIVIKPIRRMPQGKLESYLDIAANILRGNADHSTAQRVTNTDLMVQDSQCNIQV